MPGRNERSPNGGHYGNKNLEQTKEREKQTEGREGQEPRVTDRDNSGEESQGQGQGQGKPRGPSDDKR